MDIYLRKVLRTYMQELEDKLDPMDVVDELIKHDVISVTHKRALQAIDSEVERVGLFISQIQESSGNAFQVFLDALQKCGGYEDIVKELKRREQSTKTFLAQNIKEILFGPCENEGFMFCEVVCNTAEIMTKREADKLSAYYKFSDQEKKSLQSSENPGFKVMKLLLEKGCLKTEDVSTFESVLKELKLTNLEKGLKNYRASLDLPALVINVKCPHQCLASREDKDVYFEVGKSLKSLFQVKCNAVYEDFTLHNSLIVRIPFLSSLTSVRESLESGKLTKTLMPLLMINQRQENVDSLQVACDENGYNDVRDHLLKDALNLRFNMDTYLRKVLRTYTQELEEELDPMDVVDELIKHDIISVNDKKAIEAIDSQVERVSLFISQLQRSSGKASQVFLDALQKCGGYDDIVNKLKTREQSAKKTLARNIEEILFGPCENEGFMFCEVICNTAETMTKREADKLSAYYKFSDQEKKSLQSREYPGFKVMKLLLEKGFLKSEDVSKLESVLKELKLTNLEKGLQKYRESMDLSALVINVKCPDQYVASRRDKVLHFALGKSLQSLFQMEFYATYEDFTPRKSIVLRIPSLSSLTSVRESIESGKLTKMLMPLLMTKQFQENVDRLQVACDEEEYNGVRNHLLKEARGKTELTSAAVPQTEFQSYLERVGLNGQYPAKMTLKMATKIRILTKYSPTMKQSDIPLLFLTLLTSLDRRTVFPEKLNFVDSVRDFICALLHCSDDFLKQHILEKLAACQLAVPVIIPNPTGGVPTFLLWALRRIVKKWKNENDSLTPERNMVTEPLFTVAFLRIGELPVSKSHILNNMFGRAQSNATVAYFISKREDYQDDATFSKGSLEAHWYVPLKGKDGEILDELTLFLNLRGDAYNFHRQVEFVSKVANMLFILVDKSCESQNKNLIDAIGYLSSNVVTVFLKERMKNTKTQSRRKLIETSNGLEYEVDGEDIVLSKKLCELIKKTCHGLNSKDYKCIEDWSQICRSLDEEITVDEDNSYCRKAFEMSNKILQKVSTLTVQQIKEKHMPLQKLELAWVHCDQKRASRIEGHTIEVQRDNIRREKLNIRKKQLSRGLTSEMLSFYNTLHYVAVGEGSNLLHYFMVHFQAQIDKMAKKEIPPHINNIHMLENKLAQIKLQLKEEKSKSSKGILENNIAKLKEDIVRESKEYSYKHLGFEHFMRELSHLYEAQILDPRSNLNTTQMIAGLAARLLIEGYPLELLDGDTTYISITWISDVLNIVDKILKSPKIFVVSVIGVQSSGKSTLLNCMFGVRFTVRAGRCTRGLFLQMLKVDDTLQESLGFQYLVIIDTEGLQSPDRTVKNDLKFDNRLATLAMCVVDLSILNISQETIGSDMIGILQIAAHALIRMKKVQLVSRCRIVHQRVSDVNAAGENKSSMNVIKEALDKAALAAAKEENITGIKEFSDVFPFKESDNLYVPCLWMGNMSPPNHAYSETILNLKTRILARKGEKGSADFTQITLKKFQHRLEDVWDALKKEDFVFNFQNSFNALSYQRFRLEHNKWVGIMRTAMVEWELVHKENVKEGNKEVYIQELKQEIKLHLDKVLKEIDKYVSTHSDEELKRQQNTFRIFSNNIAREIEEAITYNYGYYMKTKREQESLSNFIANCRTMLRDNAKQKAIEVRQKDPTLDPKSSKESLEKMFETLWKDTTEELKKAYEDMRVKENDINFACENSLRTLMDNTAYNLKFQEIITKRGGIVVSTETFAGVQKHPKQNKMSWKSFFSLGILSGNDKNEIDHDMKQTIDKIAREEVNTFTTDERYEAFDKSHIDKFFTTLLEKLREDMQLAEEFVLEVLVETCNHIAAVSILKQKQYEEKFSLYKLMEVEKISLKSDFFSFFDNTIKTERVAEKTYTEICAKIRDKLVDHLNVQLLKKLRGSNYFTDKEFLIGTILCEICKNKSRQDYLKFVSNQDGYIRLWLKNKIIEEVATKDKSQLWVESVTSQKLADLKETIKYCLNETKKYFENETFVERNQTSADLGDNEELKESEEHGILISKWQNIFVEKCNEKDLKMALGPMIFDSVYYMSFTEMLLKMIEKTSVSNIKLDPELKLCGDPRTAEKLISKMDISPQLEILKQLQGCSEVCPFCKVGCQRQGEHSKHTARLHYPQGVAGFKDFKSKKLIVDICTSLVASDFGYRFNDQEEFRPYRNYAGEFPTWDIKPIQGDEPNKHWQWVMAQFNDYFAEQHAAQPGIIPIGWKGLTQDEALSSLKRFYNL